MIYKGIYVGKMFYILPGEFQPYRLATCYSDGNHKKWGL